MKLILSIVLIVNTIFNNALAYDNSLFDKDFLTKFYQEFNGLSQQFNHINQNDFFTTGSIRYFDSKKNSYVIKINTNIAKENITITTHYNQMVIQGKGKQQSKNTYSNSSFYQAFSLPRDADINNITTDLDQQILSINIPKLDKIPPIHRNIKIN